MLVLLLCAGSRVYEYVRNRAADRPPPAVVAGCSALVSARVLRTGAPAQLWLSSADGRRAQPLTRGLDTQHPAWSPDGQRMAFVGNDPDAGDPSSGEIYVCDPLDSPPRRLGPLGPELEFRGSHNRSLAWSPDGRWVVFCARDIRANRVDLWAMRADDGRRERLSGAGDITALPNGVAWSGDGDPARAGWQSRVAFTACPPHRPRLPDLYVRSVELSPGGELRVGASQRLTATADTFERDPAWSPDGRSLAYVINGVELRVVGDDGRTRSLLKSGHLVSSPDWSPDGRWLVCAMLSPSPAAEPDVISLFRVSADGARLEPLPVQRGCDQLWPSWRPGLSPAPLHAARRPRHRAG